MQRFVARDIVFRFPNIQTKQKIYKKKNNRQTNTKEGRALLFLCLLFFFQLFKQTSKQTKNKRTKQKQKQTNKQKRRELLPERSTSRHCCWCGRRQFYCPTMALFISWRFYILFIIVLYLIFDILWVRNLWGLVMAFENKTCLHKTTTNLGMLRVLISPWIRGQNSGSRCCLLCLSCQWF